MNTRSSSRGEQTKKGMATNNDILSNVQHQDKNRDTAILQRRQVSTNNVVTGFQLPTQANRTNAAQTQSTQGPSKRPKVAITNEIESNASKGGNESTMQATIGVQDYFLDCKHCQRFWLDVGLAPTTISYKYEPHLWESGYSDKNKDHSLHLSHANTLIMLLWHKYHNEHYVVFPTVFEAYIPDTPQVNSTDTPGNIKKIDIPTGKSLLVICVKDYRYHLLRIAQQETLKRHGVSLLANNKEWAVISLDSFKRTNVTQVKEQFKLFNRMRLKIVNSQIEYMIENTVPQGTNISSSGFYSLFVLESFLKGGALPWTTKTAEHSITDANLWDALCQKHHTFVNAYGSQVRIFRIDPNGAVALRSSITNENEIQTKLIEAHASKMREKEMEW
jgi:hypothetical protein